MPAETEQRFQTLFEQAPFSVQLLSVDGRTLRVNQAWKDLWGAQDGDPLLTYVLTDYNMLEDPQLQAKGVTPYLRRAFAGEAVRLPAAYYDPNELGKPGRARWVQATARPIKDAAGRVAEVMLIHEDVTERMQIEQQQRLERERMRESEAKFRTTTDAMPQMVWSTLPDGYHDYYNQQWYDFTGVPQGSTDGEAWNGKFHPEDQEHAWAVWRHSLATGLNNAAKYTPPNGALSLSVEAGDAVEVRVADNGLGIGAALLPHVFELFTQGERTPDRAQGGLGLGLALVKSLMELHGGQVAARSEGRGRGSVFTVTLPRWAQAPAEAAPPDIRAATAASGVRRVMVVDDNRDAAETLGMLLRLLDPRSGA